MLQCTYYSALSIYCSHLSLYNSRKTPHSLPVRVQIWPKFHYCNCCAMCTIIVYITSIYRESIVLISTNVFVPLPLLCSVGNKTYYDLTNTSPLISGCLVVKVGTVYVAHIHLNPIFITINLIYSIIIWLGNILQAIKSYCLQYQLLGFGMTIIALFYCMSFSFYNYHKH